MNDKIASEFARQKLLAYAIGMYPSYEVAAHNKLIAKKLESLERREITKLMVFMPPRHGKSFLISQMFPSWYLGRNPNHEVIFTSYSQEVASDFGRKVRNLMIEPTYKAIFSDLQVSDDSSASRRFHTNKGGAFFAAGAGGTLTSRGANLIIIDDIHKNREESHSDVITKSIKEWFGSTLYTRRMPGAVIVLVQTRWSDKDLPKHLMDTDGAQWDILNLPAINERNEALWPTRFPIEMLLEIKKTIGSHDFEALYQQQPSAEEGNLIKREWLRFYDNLPERFEEQIISVDATFTGKATSDFVAMQVWGRFGARKYLLDEVHKRMGITETISALISLCQKWKDANLKLIENKANGPAIEDLLSQKLSGIVLWEPQGDKTARVNVCAPQFEAGNVFFPLPARNPWVESFVDELVTFPNAAHDDRTDACTMALIRLDESVTRNVGTIRVLR